MMPNTKSINVYVEAIGEEDRERTAHINNFIEQVTNYPSQGGVIVNLPQEGLFEVIFDHIEKGRDGLVNK